MNGEQVVPRGVPTIRSVDHVAYTVPDLDAAVSFFVDHFGGELIFHDGPFSGQADEMTRRLNVDPRAVCRLAMVRLGLHTNLELFEYDAPEQRPSPPRNSDIGGHHLAFYVDDIDVAHAYVSAIPGVTLMDGPNGVAPDSPVAGQRWFYFLTPWGMQMELTSCPGGRFYADLPGARMAPPSEHWR
ncbi:VOC family protein [Spirillospora sp. CA-142024]|uniref:VOC family protein n=1 Tax=Spirillospora sp. CA-142024 TaxID=3240036 RepID=UPI003D8CDE7C